MRNAFLSLEYITVFLIAISAISISYIYYNKLSSGILFEIEVKKDFSYIEDLINTIEDISLLGNGTSIPKSINIRRGVLYCLNHTIIYSSLKSCKENTYTEANYITYLNTTIPFTVFQNVIEINNRNYTYPGFIPISHNYGIYVKQADPNTNIISYVPFSRDKNLYVGCLNGVITGIYYNYLLSCYIVCRHNCQLVIAKKDSKIIVSFAS